MKERCVFVHVSKAIGCKIRRCNELNFVWWGIVKHTMSDTYMLESLLKYIILRTVVATTIIMFAVHQLLFLSSHVKHWAEHSELSVAESYSADTAIAAVLTTFWGCLALSVKCVPLRPVQFRRSSQNVVTISQMLRWKCTLSNFGCGSCSAPYSSSWCYPKSHYQLWSGIPDWPPIWPPDAFCVSGLSCSTFWSIPALLNELYACMCLYRHCSLDNTNNNNNNTKFMKRRNAVRRLQSITVTNAMCVFMCVCVRVCVCIGTVVCVLVRWNVTVRSRMGPHSSCASDCLRSAIRIVFMCATCVVWLQLPTYEATTSSVVDAKTKLRCDALHSTSDTVQLCLNVWPSSGCAVGKPCAMCSVFLSVSFHLKFFHAMAEGWAYVKR